MFTTTHPKYPTGKTPAGASAPIQMPANSLNSDSQKHDTMAERIIQLFRFCSVGLACLALSVIILFTLHGLAGVNYLLAYVITFVVANITGYSLNARFTFSAHSASRAGAARYMLVNAALLCVNTVTLGLFVSRLHFWYITAAILLAGINAPVSFAIQRIVTYHPVTPENAHDA